MSKEYNLYIDQGTTFSFPVKVENVDLTTASIKAHIRKNYTTTIFTPFTIVPTDLTNGQFHLALDPATTTAMDYGRYVYDLIYQIGTSIVRVMEGIVVINPQVTI